MIYERKIKVIFHTWHHPLALGYSQQHLKYDAWRDSGKIKRAKVEILKWWRTNRPLKFFISLDSHIPIHMFAFIFENIGSIFTGHCKYRTLPKIIFEPNFGFGRWWVKFMRTGELSKGGRSLLLVSHHSIISSSSPSRFYSIIIVTEANIFRIIISNNWYTSAMVYQKSFIL